MWDLCRYKHIFGKPNTGIHTYRFFNIAIIDVMLTILLAWLIKYTIAPFTNLFEILFICFISGIIVHRIFCVRTTIDKLLF
jgi:hypothetical protein